ncbi:hypothetical protein ACPWT1_08775 [Ramlibacter sp. MMS24-I3-19]|uniref:hypothetical protein n=1 Tax=Ramlibacter sp. MMS24-I3-19 TaxID=3416606 RepID=UPI003D0660CE
MDQEEDIAGLRSRVSALVEQESGLLNQAFELSRAGGDRRGVDALFAQVQAIQVERSLLKKRIGEVLGSHRLHMASEVWRTGIYAYRPVAGGESLQVSVTKEALGLHVTLPGRSEPVRIETLEGTFDGPLAGDDAVASGKKPA